MRRIVLAMSLLLSACSLTQKSNPTALRMDTAKEDATRIEESTQLFKNALETIHEHYYMSVELKSLTTDAIEFLVQKTNSHGFLELEDERPACKERVQMGALGITFSKRMGLVTIVRVAPRSPAYEARVNIGDIIFAIDGKPTNLLSFLEIITALDCNKHSFVDLTLVSRDWKRVETKRIEKREGVVWRDFLATMLSGNIGYFSIYDMHSEKNGILAYQAIGKLKKMGATRFIIDLRSMQGGLVVSGMFFLSTVLEPATAILFASAEARDDQETLLVPKETRPLRDPLVVLVNNSTVSLGELIAMTLKDHGRATIIGERTVGYGTIMRQFYIDKHVAISLPVRIFYGPHGENIEGQGVEPDILVSETNPLAQYAPGVKDAILERAIEYLNQNMR